jgi:hypothetical protein
MFERQSYVDQTQRPACILRQIAEHRSCPMALLAQEASICGNTGFGSMQRSVLAGISDYVCSALITITFHHFT